MHDLGSQRAQAAEGVNFKKDGALHFYLVAMTST